MWKKDDMAIPVPGLPRPEEKPQRPESPKPAAPTGERATIGRSIAIRGEVSGDEDLLIQGRVDGSVDLKQQSVTVGREGRVQGIDLDGARGVVDVSPHPVWIAGGISSANDLERLEGIGARAAVLGMALYTGALDPQAVAQEYGR